MKSPTGRAPWARRVALAAMLVVTAWSVWAVAQPHPEPEAPTEAKAAEKGEEKEGPAPMNWFEFGAETPPYLAMLINFAILAGGYYFLGRKPIAAGLQSRRDSIAKDIEDAQRMKREAEERAKIYRSKLETLEEELKHARRSLVHAGQAESERIVREAEAKADRMRRDAEFLIEQELKQLRADLLRETVEAAVAAAEELLKKRITQADQERLAEDYLADLAPPQLKAASIPAPRLSARPAGPGQGTTS